MDTPVPLSDQDLPLQGLYLHLVRAGFQLSVRDLEDAHRAIRMGYGIGTRDDLHTLCRTLWARGDEEVVRLQAVFDRLARPTPDEVDRLVGRPPEAATSTSAEARPGPSAAGTASPTTESAGVTTPRAEFGDASEAGMALPSVRTVSQPAQRYLFEARPPLSMRSLVIAWRRYRVTQRSGPPVELDIDATVAEQCRTGWLLRPVFVPARRNRARLLVLVDASPSMVAWRSLHAPLAESLLHSRLGQAQLLYFDNDPLDGLFDTPSFGGLKDAQDVLRQQGEGAVLVIGDAGAARARRDRKRLKGTARFVEHIRHQGGRLAWLNPMPRDRWGDAARPLAAWALMDELSDDGLTHAVDYLRGARAN